MSQPRERAAEPAAPAAEPTSAATRLRLTATAWLVPGLGHWLLGKRQRAVVFASVILAGFVTGVLVDGELGTPRQGNPFSWLAAFACCGNGLLYLGRLLWVNGLGGLFPASFPFGVSGGGDPIAAGFSYGNTFLYTSGLMNLLAVLDVSDIARGAKE